MKKSEITKKQIMDSALQVLRKTGNLTFKEISADCGVNVASINYHYGSKELLIKELINNLIDKLKNLINSFMAVAGKDNDLNKITELLLTALYDFTDENINFLRYTVNSSHKDIYNHFNTQFSSIFTMENDFTKDMIRRIKAISGDDSTTNAMVKYIIMVSSFAFPISFDLNLLEANPHHNPFPISNENIKELYVKTLLQILTLKA